MSQHFTHWKIEKEQDNIVWLLFDKANVSTNSINQLVLEELEQILGSSEIIKASGLVITSAKQAGFIAGADLTYIQQIEDVNAIKDFMYYGHKVFSTLERLPIPTLALINGFCMGGGLELALACDYRIADEEATLGLPEVNIGIHPAWGGCVRLPKLIGALKAMDIILTGRPIRAKAARAMGFVDAIVPKRQYKSAAHYYLQHKPAKHRATVFEKITNLSLMRTVLAKVFRSKVKAKANPKHYPAPFAAIDLWKHYGVSDAALMKEAESGVRMAHTETAKNLLRVFFLQDGLKALGKAINHPVSHVHVVGAGTMGGDIAAWCALKGKTVTIQDREDRFIAPAIARAHKLFTRKLKDPRKVMQAMDRLIPDVGGDGIRRADVIIEAIVENLAIKQELFKQLEAQAKPDAILATNTSSIPLQEIATCLNNPARLIGIHFFNPVAKMPLVEVVKSEKTDSDVINQTLSFVANIGKLPLPVASTPGFLVNRILMPYLMEAVTLLDEGKSASVIDKAATDFGMPMGPIELADQVGLDICQSVAENLTKHFGGTVPQSLLDKVNRKELGKKTNKGYYQYKQGKKVKTTDASTSSSHEFDDIQQRLILRMINEAVCCLREGVVENTEHLDAGMIFGAGFAFFRGGPLHYAKQRGILQVVEQLQQLQQKYGERFTADAAWETI